MPSTSKCNWPKQPISETLPVLQPVVATLIVHLPRQKIDCLPRHLVGLVTLSQAEGAREVASQQVHLLDVGNQSLVDGLLVGGTAAADLLLL